MSSDQDPDSSSIPSTNAIFLADASSVYTFAFKLLHEPLKSFCREGLKTEATSNSEVTHRISVEKYDFASLCKCIQEYWDSHFKNSSPKQLKSSAERCLTMRNKSAHQASITHSSWLRDMEKLTALSKYIGADDVARKITERVQRIREDKDPIPQKKSKSKKKVNSVAKTTLVLENISDEPNPEDAIPIESKVNEDCAKAMEFKISGNTYFNAGNFTEAMGQYSKAIELSYSMDSMQRSLFYSNRALCELKLKKFDLAREDAEDAIQLDEKNVKFYRILAESLISLQLFSECVSTCSQGLKLDPRDETLLLYNRDAKSVIARQLTDEEMIRPKPTDASLLTLEKLSSSFFAKKTVDAKPLASEICTLTMSMMRNLIQNASMVVKAHRYRDGDGGNRPDFSKALELYEKAGLSGNPEGLYNAAIIYGRGPDSVPRNLKKKIELLRLAVTHKPYLKLPNGPIQINIGVAEAENGLGVAYRDGSGVDKDDKMAFSWFLKAASHQLAEGQNNAGYSLRNGIGVAKDEVSARQWFEKASQDDVCTEALNNFADMLANGMGGPRNAEQARILYQKTASRGSMYGVEQLRYLQNISATQTGMPVSEILNNLAMEKNDKALVTKGLWYLNGSNGFIKSIESALSCFRMAESLGNYQAAYLLGKTLLHEKKENEKGFLFLLKAAEGGIVEAQAQVSDCYSIGCGCEYSIESSRKWWKRASKQGFRRVNQLTSEVVNFEETIKFHTEIVELERKLNLESKGMSISDRILRYQKLAILPLVPDENKHSMDESMTLFHAMKNSNPPTSENLTSNFTKEAFADLVKKAEEGWIQAQRLLQAMDLLLDACETKSSELILAAYREAKLLDDLFPVNSDQYELLEISARRALHSDSNNIDALIWLGNHRPPEEQMQFFQECISNHNEVAEFHYSLSCCYGFAQQFNLALKSIREALRLKPDQFDWLYTYATTLRLSQPDTTNKLNSSSSMAIIDAYKHFLSESPADNRKVPESLFCIGLEYLGLENDEYALKYYQLGIEAEQPGRRLLIYKPCLDFPARKVLHLYYSTKTNQTVSHSLKECNSCGLPGAISRCSKCKNSQYCNRICQKAHWKIHKRECQSKKI